MNQITLIMIIIVLGLLLGRISFFGVKFGMAGILLIGLVFGHYGYKVNSFVTDFGLLLFITGIGFIAGPIFINNFKNKAISYIVIAIGTILFASLLTAVLTQLLDIPIPLSLGVMTGALTSTPGLGAAVENTQSNLALVGYGITYPFGVIGVILFVHTIIRITNIDPKRKAADFVNTIHHSEETVEDPPRFHIDDQGFAVYFLAIIVGVLIGRITLPLPGGVEISLGNAGGALVSGLLFGHIGNIEEISLEFKEENARLISDLGLALF